MVSLSAFSQELTQGIENFDIFPDTLLVEGRTFAHSLLCGAKFAVRVWYVANERFRDDLYRPRNFLGSLLSFHAQPPFFYYVELT